MSKQSRTTQARGLQPSYRDRCQIRTGDSRKANWNEPLSISRRLPQPANFAPGARSAVSLCRMPSMVACLRAEEGQDSTTARRYSRNLISDCETLVRKSCGGLEWMERLPAIPVSQTANSRPPFCPSTMRNDASCAVAWRNPLVPCGTSSGNLLSQCGFAANSILAWSRVAQASGPVFVWTPLNVDALKTNRQQWLGRMLHSLRLLLRVASEQLKFLVESGENDGLFLVWRQGLQ